MSSFIQIYDVSEALAFPMYIIGAAPAATASAKLEQDTSVWPVVSVKGSRSSCRMAQ